MIINNGKYEGRGQIVGGGFSGGKSQLGVRTTKQSKNKVVLI